MSLTFRMIEKKDYKKAIDFAVRGMHCDVYFRSRFLSRLYGRMMLYLGLSEATQVIAAYDKNQFLGLLLARMDGEERCFHSFFQSLFLDAIQLLSGFFSGSAGEYVTACQKMLSVYKEQADPDGEMTLFVADTDRLNQGIGTAIFEEFRRRERGKLVYLYTDEYCSWQFYDHRGFARAGEEDIVMQLGSPVPLKCMLYSIRL